MLSLVLVVIIVANVVLWSYEMNHFDWEMLHEDVKIINVASSSVFIVESEYTVNIGSRTGGTYLETQTVNDQYERFREATGVSNTTLVDAESFEGDWLPSDWNATSSWARESDYVQDGIYSADFDGSAALPSGYLTSPSMDCSDAIAIYVDFWWYDGGLDNDDFELEYYNGSAWINHQDLNRLESSNGWHHYTENLTDNQYFFSNFHMRWWAKSLRNGETSCVDLVNVKKESPFTTTGQLDLNGTVAIDLSLSPLDFIQTIEIHERYMADDAGEKWYLKAYNWSSSTYSDNGFNSTAGHTPTTGWDDYVVDLTDQWQSYIRSDGTMLIKLVDNGPDDDQTTIDIDYLSVRIIFGGTTFTFENKEALTSHLVSLWVNNATHHKRYDVNIFINAGEALTYLNNNVSLPDKPFIIKVITERGNVAIYSKI